MTYCNVQLGSLPFSRAAICAIAACYCAFSVLVHVDLHNAPNESQKLMQVASHLNAV